MDNWFINLGMYHPRHGNGGRGMPMQPMQPGGHTFASGYFRWILRDHEVPHQQQAGSDGFWPTFKGEVLWRWHKQGGPRWHRDIQGPSIDSRFNMEISRKQNSGWTSSSSMVVFLSFQIFSPKTWGEKTSCFLQGEFRGAGLSGSLPVTVGGGSVGLFEKQQPKKW